METYINYFQTTILNFLTGLKLVLGGTGLGKTFGALSSILLPENSQKKFIYIAARIQLLLEFKEKLKNENINFCYQEKDEDLLIQYIKEAFELLEDKVLKNYIDYLSKNNKTKSVSQHKKDLKKLKKILDELNSIDSEILKENFQKQIGEISSPFFQLLKNCMNLAFKVSTNKINIKDTTINDYHYLSNLPIIRKLFPYLEFSTSDKPQVLLVTIQKAFFGLFNGNRTISLDILQNPDKENPYIIFLDEFDFLERELLTLLAQDVNITNPFTFVKRFYDNLTTFKLPYENFLKDNEEVKNEITNIIQTVDSLQNHNINFPHINHFDFQETDKELGNISIFLTRNSITNRKIFIDGQNGRTNSFTIHLATKKANIFTLLNTVNISTTEIIRLLKLLKHSKPNIYKDLITFCYDDSEGFKRQINAIKHPPFARTATDTDYSKLYLNGYGLFEITNPRYISDQNQVKLTYYSMVTSPENIISNLASNNLVFALSATANFDRIINNFDTRWLKEQLGNKFIYPSKEDLETIKTCTLTKQNLRNNNVAVRKMDLGLDDSSKLKISLRAWVNHIENKDSEIFGNDNYNYRKNRAHAFFETLVNIVEGNSTEHTHLMFFNSIKQLKGLFSKFDKLEDEGLTNFNIQQSDSYYKVSLAGKEVIVFFYDADEGKKIYKTQSKNYFELFWKNIPVIVPTTYNSASTGINLQYFKSKQSHQQKSNPDTDFQGIHLVECPYFFFAQIDEEKTFSEIQNSIKSNIFKLAKLDKNKILTTAMFTTYLNNIRKSHVFNQDYQNTFDALINKIVTYIQANGRSERVREKMQNQTFYLFSEVYKDIEAFVKTQEYQKMKPTLSYNNQMVFESVFNNIENRTIQLEQVSDSISSKNEACRRRIHKMLKNHELLRKGVFKDNPKKADRIRRNWANVRITMLRNNYFLLDNNEVDLEMMFKTDHFDYLNNGIWINNKLKIVPSENTDDSYYLWKMDNVFNPISSNKILRGYFEHRSYQLGTIKKGYFFLPILHQSILVGAIGEEVIKAVFKYETVFVDEDSIPDALFELADLKIEDKPWFIDCKNYGYRTMAQFNLPEEDPLFRPKLNSPYFIKSAQRKLNQINDFYKTSKAKLIYINAFGSEKNNNTDNEDSFSAQYFDANFKPLSKSFEKASIIIIPAVISRNEAADNYTDDFKYLINQIKS